MTVITSNCPCTCGTTTPYPVSFVFTKFDGLFGYTSLSGSYLTDLGSVDVEIQITWSNGTTTTEVPTNYLVGWAQPYKVHATSGSHTQSSGTDSYQADFTITWPEPGSDVWSYQVNLAMSDAVGRSFPYVRQ